MHSSQSTLHESGAVVVLPSQDLPAFALPVHAQVPFTQDDATVQLDELPPPAGGGLGALPGPGAGAGGAPPPPVLQSLQSVLQESGFVVVAPSQTFPALAPPLQVHVPSTQLVAVEHVEELPPPALPFFARHFWSSARHAALPAGAWMASVHEAERESAVDPDGSGAAEAPQPAKAIATNPKKPVTVP